MINAYILYVHNIYIYKNKGRLLTSGLTNICNPELALKALSQMKIV